jgi:hypothetical protein
MKKELLRHVLIAIGSVGILAGANLIAAPESVATTPTVAPASGTTSAAPAPSNGVATKLITPMIPPAGTAPHTNSPSVKTNHMEPHYPTNADPRFNTNGFYRGVGTNRVPAN